MVIALLLPERLAATLKQQVGSASGGGFERPKKLRDTHLRRQKQMNVIGHNHKGVHLVMCDFSSELDRRKDQSSNGGLPEEGGPRAGVIKQPIHRDERLHQKSHSTMETTDWPEEFRADRT